MADTWLWCMDFCGAAVTMNIRIKPSFYIPAFVFLIALMYVEWALGLSVEWICLTFLVLFGLLMVALANVLERAPSPRPATWVFVISFTVLGIAAWAFYLNNQHAYLLLVALIVAGLGVLFGGIRRNRRWAWNLTRYVFTALLVCGFVRGLAMPFIPGAFQREFVSELGWLWGVPVYILELVMGFGLVLLVRDALTPSETDTGDARGV